MTETRVVDPAEVVLSRLLARFPTGKVVAIGPSGVLVPIPEEVPLTDHCVLAARSHLVVPSELKTVIGLYARARVGGQATGLIHLAGEPDRTYTAYVVDCRTRYGVVIGVLGDASDRQDGFEQWSPPQLPPRLARASKDGSAVYCSCDRSFTELLGWESEDVVGHRALEFVHPDDHDIGIANWIDMLDTPGPGRRVRLRHQHRDGHWMWLEITNHNRLHDPEHADVVADMVDISEEMAAQEALRAREHLLFELTQAVPLGLFYCAPDGKVIFANQKLSEFLAVETIEKLSDLVDAIHGEDVPAVRRALSTALAGQGESDIELRISSPVDPRYGSLRLRTILSPEGALSGVIGCLEDVTDGVLRRKRLEARATVDPLTGCLNRDSAMAVLTSTIDGLQQDGNPGLAVVYVDLDRFKPINDAYGHATGDGLLTEVAERLRRSIRAGDRVGRVGGDEFIVICSSVATARDALHIGEAISDRVCQVAVVSGHEIPVRASTGVVWTDRAVSDPDLLVGAADAAMYRSKRGAACRAVLGDPMQLRR